MADSADGSLNDHNAPGQPSARRAGKRPRSEADARYRKNIMAKAKAFDEVSEELKKIKQENDHLKKSNEEMKEQMQKQSGDGVELLQSLNSSLSIGNASNNRLISFLSEIMVVFRERDELRKENNELKTRVENLQNQQPLVNWPDFGLN